MYLNYLQRFAVISDRSALWSIDAYLEELRGKIGQTVKCAIPKSKVVWLNLTATRYRTTPSLAFRATLRPDGSTRLGVVG